MTVRVAINGFGRVGRLVFRRAFDDGDEIEIRAVNDLLDIQTNAHLLKHDTTHGAWGKYVKAIPESVLSVGDSVVFVSASREVPDWRKLGIDIVVESTGVFTKRADLGKKVILTAPAATGEDVDLTVVMGVNEDKYDPVKHYLISNASCTTNCLAPVARVLHEKFGIVKGWMSTIHAYTNDQRLLDLSHKDLRRARAASENFLPASTGAAKAIGLVIPELAGKLDGAAWRVPVKDVSSIDLVVEVERAATVEEVNAAFGEAARDYSRYLDCTDEELVSSDYIGNPFSAIVDAKCTKVLGGNMVRVVAWYDNEWAYSCRVVDLIKYIYPRGL